MKFQKSQWIITGSSRGLGLALTQMALDSGAEVIGLARSAAGLQHPKYLHIQADLGKIDDLKSLNKKLSAHLNSKAETLVLINNAGKVSPIGQTGTLSHEEIIQSSNVNFLAVTYLTNLFLELAKGRPAQLVVANVTSGVAKYPKPLWAIYSAAKAAINAYSEALAGEIAPHHLICFEPGIIDTEMQNEIRSLPPAQFPEVGLFQKFKSEGQLRSPEAVAQVLMKAIESSSAPAKGKMNYVSV